MAENIYVGNRYVPYYDGLWDAAKQYESLTAVTQDNNAYISRKPVPAGTPVTDQEFWAFWGSGNAVIDALSTRVTALEGRVNGVEVRLTASEQEILDLASRMTNAETNIDQLFATTNAHDDSISQLLSEISAIKNTISAMQSDINTLQNTTEKVANKNTGSGYMGMKSGAAAGRTLYSSPIIMCANLTSAQTLTSGEEIVRFNNVIDDVPQLGQSIVNSNGNFLLFSGGFAQTYDVWISTSVLCVPNGNSGVKDIYLFYGTEMRHASEGYVPNQSTRLSIQIPEVYLGRISPGTYFGVKTQKWTANDVIGQGTIVGDNYGSSWISIKAYPVWNGY